jgi:hypothetical protein
MAVYSHIIPPDTSSEDLTVATKPFYDGPLKVANDLMTISVDDEIVVDQVKIGARDVFEKSSVLK